MRRRPNYLAGVGSTVWLFVVGLPLYVMLAATLRTRGDYAANGPVSVPDTFTLDNYFGAFDADFGQYFLNTVAVTAAVVALVLVLVPPLSFAIVRSRSRVTSLVFRLFLLGLAIPAQAVIVPMFYLISEAGLYDNLLGVILPTAAFCLPMSALILSGAMRDISPSCSRPWPWTARLRAACSSNWSYRSRAAACPRSRSSPRSRHGTASCSRSC